MYDYLKPYIEPQGNANYQFYPVSQDEILEAEKRMEMAFPSQLKEFYQDIGYGFFNGDQFNINRIMSPSDIADFMCNDEPYDCIDKSIYEENEMPFMHISGEDFLTIVSDGDDKGSILYFGTKIAESFYSFVEKMYREPNFYLRKEAMNKSSAHIAQSAFSSDCIK